MNSVHSHENHNAIPTSHSAGSLRTKAAPVSAEAKILMGTVRKKKRTLGVVLAWKCRLRLSLAEYNRLFILTTIRVSNPVSGS